MKNATAAQKTLPRQSRAPLMTKLGLALIFALGIVIIVMGVQGQRAYDTSGFSAESAYGAIYDLSKDVNAAWENQLRPQLAGLPDGQRTQTDAAVRALVDAAWESAAPGSVQDVEALLAAAPENDRTALTYKLLSAAYLVNGPKVSTAQKKEIAVLSDADLATFRQAVLNGVTDESAALPAAAAKAADLQGQERQAMLMQLLLTSFDTSDSGDAVMAVAAHRQQQPHRRAGGHRDRPGRAAAHPAHDVGQELDRGCEMDHHSADRGLFAFVPADAAGVYDHQSLLPGGYILPGNL